MISEYENENCVDCRKPCQSCEFGEVVEKNMELTDNEINEWVRLADNQYFRLRLIQVLEKLAVAHGCSCIDGECGEPHINDEDR